MRSRVLGSWVLVPGSIVLAGWLGAQAADYQRSTRGTRVLERGALSIKVLVEQANLGSGEVEVAEITFPPGSQSGDHRHGSTEILYIVSGSMDHVVNGVSHRLEPGMVGIVRPGDTVSHVVPGSESVKAVVVWTPGGEATRIAPLFTEKAID